MGSYKFMRGKKFNGHEVELCKEFVTHYQKTLSIALHDKRKIQQELNNLTIARTAFNPNTDKPYIPGSGIKGALRTAYLNLLAAAHPVGMSPGRATAKDLEKTLLDGGSFETDPFRMLKVSDFVPVDQGKTKIVFAVNEKKKTSKFEARGPYQIVEVIEPGSFFQGWITIENPDKKTGIANPITQKKLFQSLNQFYENEKSREDKELNAIDITPISISDNNGWLVRIGRHSGAESITIEGHRNIKIMKGKGTPPAFSKNGATTFWLASEEEKPKIRGKLKPFGWAVLGDVTEEVGKSFQQIETAHYEEIRLRQAQQEESSQTPGDSLPGQLFPPASRAKTAVGFGRFTIDKEIQLEAPVKKTETAKVEPSLLDKCCMPFKTIKASEAGEIGPLIDTALKTLTSEEDKKAFANFVKEFMGGEFKKSKAREKLKSYWP